MLNEFSNGLVFVFSPFIAFRVKILKWESKERFLSNLWTELEIRILTRNNFILDFLLFIFNFWILDSIIYKFCFLKDL